MRPKGVVVLGGLVMLASSVIGLAGLAGVLWGLAGLLPGIPFNFTVLTSGLLYMLIALFLLVAGVGIVAFRLWAWWLTMTAVAAPAAIVGYEIVSRAVRALPAEPLQLVSFIVLVSILTYLLSVKRQFRRRPAIFEAWTTAKGDL